MSPFFFSPDFNLLDKKLAKKFKSEAKCLDWSDSFKLFPLVLSLFYFFGKIDGSTSDSSKPLRTTQPALLGPQAEFFRDLVAMMSKAYKGIKASSKTLI